ncbi:bifunctional 5,10-methylene-tetrahydrofolate dehydrogenase/ 5,10-methylene-tetrahydrofolate cyclohydrolase [Leptospira ryugenii]|uniref:Bifunctional protein FolD n=1 Tax=Leptospira ryugenii TaxID=1917863 RepID=A0A2P2DWV1_9LEPT|nr:tetrahydrofolate dehydrogenase/cyclohydrolase catalytic domain-containing protein [Leptospira ryugenii]GBF49111.1 bifunctional 5,10-methylene-tetrahydrofolate dehydrogenase/ 5,10-methylene-tetrahydrofolate cyclohydrolase [Leptospira ryugenii]
MNPPILLNGKAISEQIKSKISEELKLRVADTAPPTLATILVGEDPASATYVSMKIKACHAVGIQSRSVTLPKETTTEELLKQIHTLNNDPNVNGILLQHPVPHQIEERACFDAILPEKDVDGVTTTSFGKLAMGKEAYFPCTPYGMILLLQEYGIGIAGKHAVVVGRSPILGKPMASMLTNLDATVTLCHSKTKDLPDHVRQADIVVGAVGKPEFIKADWIKEGAVLLDAGYNVGNVGDIEISKAKEKSSYYTPVPGGVGPMTIAVLLLQTLYSYQSKFSPILRAK